MGFRDEQEAARLRIQALEREVASFRKARKPELWGFLVPLLVPLHAMIAGACGAGGLAVLYVLYVVGQRPADHARQLTQMHEGLAAGLAEERSTSRDLRQQLEDARAASARETEDDIDDVIAWARPSAASAAWRGRVTERVGDGPAPIGASCTITLDRSADEASQCDVAVACDGVAVYPAPDRSSRATCSFAFGQGFHVLGREGARQLFVRDHTVRVQESAAAMLWSVTFEREPSRPPPCESAP